MKPNTFERVRPTLESVFTTARRPEPAAVPVPETPEWLLDVLAVIIDKFAASKDARGELSEEDENEYLRQFAGVGETQARQVLSLLRSRHHWRPSIAQVRAAVDEVRGEAGKVAALPAAERQLLRSAADLRREAERIARGNQKQRLIAGSGESAARQAARDLLRNNPGWRLSRHESGAAAVSVDLDQGSE